MEKIKQFIQSDTGKDIAIVLIVILVGISSFFLGRLSKNEDSSVQVEMPANTSEYLPASPIQADFSREISTTVKGNYFASKRGKKYYSAGCSAGKTIKQENRVYFDTEDEAQKAGYTISTSCQ